MKLNITHDRFDNKTHSGDVFPNAKDRKYAYQGEQGVVTSITLSAHPPYRNGGKENWNLDDPKYSHYELVINRHTSSGISVQLIGHRKDIVEQRKATGRAVLRDILLTNVDFGTLCNLIFADGALAIEETEAFPKSVESAMKQAYP